MDTTLYERWLKSPMQEGESLIAREKGTPQCGVISPLLANLYLHYALDMWMCRNYPEISFERYADDAVLHCNTKENAEEVLGALKERMKECGPNCQKRKQG